MRARSRADRRGARARRSRRARVIRIVGLQLLDQQPTTPAPWRTSASRRRRAPRRRAAASARVRRPVPAASRGPAPARAARRCRRARDRVENRAVRRRASARPGTRRRCRRRRRSWLRSGRGGGRARGAIGSAGAGRSSTLDQRRTTSPAEPAERLDDRHRQDVVAEQRHQPRRDPRIVDPRERVDRGKGEEEIARLRDVAERRRRRRGARSRPSASIAWNRTLASGSSSAPSSASTRRGVPLLAERERRLDAQIGIGCAAARERRGDVDVRRRQQLQRAAEDAEVVVLVAQRREERGEQVARGVPDRSGPRRAGPASCRGGARGEGLRRVQASTFCSARRRAGARGPLGAAASARSASSRAVTSSIVAMTPTTRSPSRSGPSVTRCCMRSKCGDGARGAHGIR